MKRRSPLALIIFLLLVAIVMGVNFTQFPSINEGATTYTDDDLVCSWIASGDATSVNITWYHEGMMNLTTLDTTLPLDTSSTIPSSQTTKNEDWRCSVTLFNGTHNVSSEDNVTIENSAPITPILYDGATDVSVGMNLTEDMTTVLDLNSSDLDNDVLLYYLKTVTFCSVTNSATGTVSCTPTHDEVKNASEQENATEVNVTFWVDDDDPIFAKSSSLKVTFNIMPVNDAPNASISDQTTEVNATFNQTFSITDEENNFPANASVDLAGTSDDVEDDITVSVESGSTLRIVYETNPIEYSDVGNHTVSINITDGLNASTLATFTLEITSVNQAPYFVSIEPSNYSSPNNYTYVLDQGENIFINLTAYDPDANITNETIFFTDDTSIFVTNTSNSSATATQNATGFINYTPVNADVGNHSVTITITDQDSATNTTVLNFTINNVNDAPVIHNQSFDPSNTAGNVNITNLTAYLEAPFTYQINYTDLDLLIGLDTLTWMDNTSTFNVSAAGLISFIPTGLPRNETINITVTDLGGLNDTVIINLEIRNNTAPYYNDTFPQLNCSEGSDCYFNVSYYAKEDDLGDNVTTYVGTFVGANFSSFTIDAATGIMNFTPLQTEIGNYTLNLTIADSRAATAWQLLNISINNTEDAPVWITYNFSGETIVEDHEFNFLLYADDQDLLINLTESLTLTANLTWLTITVESTTGNRTRALLSFTPNSSQTGAQSVELNVTDVTGRVDTVNLSFTVLNDTDPPVIEDFRPYGNGSDHAVDAWFDNGAGFSVDNIIVLENTTWFFAVNMSDDETALDELNYTWYYDGALIQGPNNTNSTSYDFDFYSQGTHTLMVHVNDTTLESSTFSWGLTVEDVNRPPEFLTNYTENISIDSTTTKQGFFRLWNGQKFYDPDDDLDDDGEINEVNETLNLTFNSSGCSHATLEAIGDDLKLTPLSVGTCIVTFGAEDPYGASVSSNLVTINVIEVPQGSQSSSVSSGGGGGGTTTQNTLIPISMEVETPYPLSIVAPGRVTIYENQTVEVPILVSNNWTGPLYGVLLSATANVSGLEFSFDSDYIEELDVGASALATLTVEGYRLGENFEVTVHANVSNPEVHDSVLVTFNAIESTSKDADEVQVKVTFAQDLLSQNEECQELNEYLEEATQYMQEGNIAQARELLDFVINGCKYMISKTSPEMQEPGLARNPFVELDEATVKAIAYIALGVLLLVSLIGILYHHHVTKGEYDF